jgi:hypothetical protein
LTDLYQQHGKKLTLNLHSGQTKAWDSTSRFTFIIAGTQSGKTSFEPHWLDREIRTCGPGDYLAVTATYDLFKLKFLPEMTHYFCDIFGWKYSPSDRVIWRGDGKDRTRIILRSANAPGGLESATAKAAVLDECGQSDFTLGAWEAVLRRLSISQGRVFGGTTPYNLGWLKTQVFDRWRNGDRDYKVVQFPSTLNPSFPQQEYDRAMATLPAWKFAMYYNGQFDRPAGLIYGDYLDEPREKNGHLVTPFDIPPEWPRWVGIDPGADNTATIWVALDPERNVYYLYRETCQGGLTTRLHAEAALELASKENVIGWYLGQKSEKQYRMDWQEHGIFAQEPYISDVEGGIDRVIELFRTRQLFVFDTLAGLRDELGSYSRKLDDRDEPTIDIKDKEKYHRLDALRYLAVGITSSPRPQVRRL